MTDAVGAAVEPTPDALDGEVLARAYDEIAEGETKLFPEPKVVGDEPEGEEENSADEANDENSDQPQTDKDEPQEDQEAQPETLAVIDRPQSWSPEKDELWKSLSPDAQELVAQRETEAQQQISRMVRHLSAYEPLGELLSQHRQTFERNGLDPVSGVKALLDAQTALDTDPVSGLAAIAGRYGLNRVQLAQALTGRGPVGPDGKAAPVDPAMMQLSSEMSSLKSQLAERDRADQARLEQQERSAQMQTDQDVQRWATNPDSPKPYFKEARPTMATLMLDAAQRNEALSLDDAYDMAVNAIPGIRAKVQAEAKAQETARRQAVAKKNVAEAKRSGAVNAGSSRPARPAPNGKWDDPDALSDAFDAIASAG